MSLNTSPRRGRILVPANLETLKGGIVGNSVNVPSFLNDREVEGATEDDNMGGDYHRMNSPN